MNGCPFLGLAEDPQTSAVFPSEQNFCHHLASPAPIQLEHQKGFCLTAGYTGCPAFSGKPLETLPVEIRAQEMPEPPRPMPVFWILALLILLALSMAVVWLYLQRGF
jgi:hypothetical protein